MPALPGSLYRKRSIVNPKPLPQLNPPPRLLMGPGPVDVDPRVLRAMSLPMLGQFDPAFTQSMNQCMALYRQVFKTANHWTLMVDGTARAGTEAMLNSILSPGDRVLVPIFGRFGHLLCEIARRCRAEVISINTAWGTVFDPGQIETAIHTHRPKLLAVVQGDTSTTMAQPLDQIGPLCRRAGVFVYVDATASIAGMDLRTDEWQLDAVSAGLQKCLSGPPGIAPLTINQRLAEIIAARKHIEQGIRPADYAAAAGAVIQSNYLDLGMVMDYWSNQRLNHHTAATSMLYAAFESARLALEEGLDARFQRHRVIGAALAEGLAAMDLQLFGDQTRKMPNITGVHIPPGIDGEAVRATLIDDFGIEIGTSFGPLHGKIWRIGTMGYGARKRNVLLCLGALEAALRKHGFRAPPGAGVDTAMRHLEGAPA
ncbi:MAG: aminotransferase class V-fold PLP-dependent enzyme [Gammaproteobacteria bacterium]|nr:aminotransferase class V-fold PLP-dependent enzyme [Gammaproteobacteria bacterium]